jgi:hypothetical protein
MGLCEEDNSLADPSSFLPGEQAGMVSHGFTLRSKQVNMAIQATQTEDPKTPPAHRSPLTAHRT